MMDPIQNKTDTDNANAGSSKQEPAGNPGATTGAPASWETLLHGKMEKVEQAMKSDGQKNGTYGIDIDDDLIDGLTTAEAQRLYHELNAQIEFEIERLNQNIQDHEKEHQRTEKKYDAAVHHSSSLNHTRQYNSGSFSRGLMYFYLFTGFFILIADIPLALQLIQIGFKFPEPAKRYAFDRLFTSDGLSVIGHNWEVVATALGISFSTVMIKVIYDEFIATPFGHSTLQRKRFFALFSSQQEHNQDVGFSWFQKTLIYIGHCFKSGVKWLILGFTIFVVITLGDFRGHAFSIRDMKKVYTDSINVVQNSSDLQANPQAITDSIAHLNNRQNKALNRLNDDAKNSFKNTFVYVTLLFPLISGICFSLALSILHNRRNKRKEKQELSDLAEDLRKISQTLSREKAELTAWQFEKNYFASSVSWIAAFARRLKKLYLLGFRIGRIRPDLVEPLPDLMTIIETWRAKAIYYKTNQKILTLMPRERDNFFYPLLPESPDSPSSN